MKLVLYALEVVGEIIGGIAATTIFVSVKSMQFGFEVGDRIDAWIDRTAEAIKSECPNCGPKGKGRWKVRTRDAEKIIFACNNCTEKD